MKNYEPDEIYTWKEMPKIVFVVTEGNLDDTIDLDMYTDYLQIRIKNIIKTYDNGKETITTNLYNLVKCPDEFFENEFENKY